MSFLWGFTPLVPSHGPVSCRTSGCTEPGGDPLIWGCLRNKTWCFIKFWVLFPSLPQHGWTFKIPSLPWLIQHWGCSAFPYSFSPQGKVRSSLSCLIPIILSFLKIIFSTFSLDSLRPPSIVQLFGFCECTRGLASGDSGFCWSQVNIPSNSSLLGAALCPNSTSERNPNQAPPFLKLLLFPCFRQQDGLWDIWILLGSNSASVVKSQEQRGRD